VKRISMVPAEAIAAFACLNLLTICSAVCNLRFIWVSFQKITPSAKQMADKCYRIPSNPQWYILWGSRQKKNGRKFGLVQKWLILGNSGERGSVVANRRE